MKYRQGDEDFAPIMTLPQHGTTIEFHNQYTGEVFAELIWSDGVFNVQAL